MRFRVVSLLFISVAAACNRTSAPTSPSPTSPSPAVAAASSPGPVVNAIDWRCVGQPAGNPGMFAQAAGRAECRQQLSTNVESPAPIVTTSTSNACATCDAPPLPVPGPSGLTAAVSGTTVTLSWFVQTVTSYVIEVGSAPGLRDLAAIDVGNPPGNPVSVAFTNVDAGTYYVRVRSYLAGRGLTLPSNEAFVIVGGTPCPPGAPTGLVATVDSLSVKLVWNVPGGCNPDRYIIEAGSVAGASDLANFSIDAATPSLSASGVRSGVYYVRVRAARGPFMSGPSTEVVVTVGNACAVPLAPSNLNVAVSGSSISLRWNPPTVVCGEPTSYVVEAGSAPGLSDLASVSTRSTAATFSAAGVPDGTYYIRVRAAIDANIGPASNEVIARVNALLPNVSGTWFGNYTIDQCTNIDIPGVTPVNLCAGGGGYTVLGLHSYRLELSQDGSVVRGSFRFVDPLIGCPCGGDYGTMNVVGTITADGALELSGDGGLRGTGVAVTAAFHLRMLTAATLSGPFTGTLGPFGGAPRSNFSGGIISSTRQ